ncbi:hypothetical protein ASPCAL02427 [Aspergillus calidoustus]|uniref:Protein kinase domain-containing protein n=1 Tax=Aspergillus calidoustus TaxID=454130 RepID=A0A0U5CMP1_ASPCI|nr:hypothetical protein ASPCAL02427 [Aspergillus calidoustus]
MGGLFSGMQAIEDARELRRKWQAQAAARGSTPPLVPPEADQGAGIHALFMEPVQVVPHRDGTCLVAYAGKHHCDFPDEPNPYEVRARDAHEFLLEAAGGAQHPRIVKYLGPLTPGFKLEFVTPGSLEGMRLPVLSPVPLPDNDSPPPLLLRLYYRWALQTLGALRFLHSHAVYLSNFCDCSVWIRADFSMAVTSFICATVPSDEDPTFLSGGCRANNMYLDFLLDVEAEYDPETGEQLLASPRGDICDWATLFWLLLTNGFAVDQPPRPRVKWPMLFPEDPATGEGWPTWWDERKERQLLSKRRFHQLEEARMGGILVKAWSGGYKGVDEVIWDLRALLEKKGVEVLGEDEILPINGESSSWEDMLITVPPGEIRFRERGGRKAGKVLSQECLPP